MNVPYKNVHRIINSAAGKDEPVLNTINKVFDQHEIDWQVSITKKFGDATRLVKQAIDDGVDLVAGYGGDGTQMEIANAAMGTDTPMAILPWGTGNAMSYEFRVPRKLDQAAELICQSAKHEKSISPKSANSFFYAACVLWHRRERQNQPGRLRLLWESGIYHGFDPGVKKTPACHLPINYR